ncbi:hypothetical protein CPJCM30710_03140 [Clostridium polyendosporum]|uniref:VTT domain-containing protein n=1 Tax=Clostridium polyendosporum TaxID=69208 RepID=A0A919VKI6_9CLOT|nr:VTT domain-containing protein [Clostridium polyendosporum]GIM27648.1 hypothetical protein CPJCM30710_03140 [Clostridium polyendosporum]
MEYMINILINYGILGIMVSAFCEAIFMPIPMELISIPIALINPQKAFLYSLVLIFFSAIGSIVGYFIGKSAGRTILYKLISEKTLIKVENLYNKNAFLTILTSTFTPIPYETYVLSAGIFKVGLPRFLSAAVISRSIRYIPQGILITLYGENLINSFKNYALFIGITIFIIMLLLKFIRKGHP